MESYPILQIGIIFLIIIYIIRRPRVGKDEPPLVPYTIPILGHTYSYLFNTKPFIRECKEKYGECFSIYIFGRVNTVVTKKYLNEVLRFHDDFVNAISEFFPFDLIFENIGLNNLEEIAHINAKIAREQVSAKFDVYTPMVQRYLLKGIDKWIGDCKEPKEIPNAWTMTNIVIASPISNILVGEEAASNVDVVNSLANLAFDVGVLMAVPPVLTFISQRLHNFIMALPMKFGWNPMSRHRENIIKSIKPVIEKRLKERKTLGDNYKPYDDVLEYLLNLPDFHERFLFYVDSLLLLAFAAIGTTSRTAANALYDIGGRQDCLNELYEEAVVIDKECNGSITMSDIQKMKKLDSFIKESLRHSDDTISIPHSVKSSSFTFSNGFTIPKGRVVNMYLEGSLKSKDAFGDDADEFKPFQFVNSNSPATKIDRNYVVFGGGKHACPGRFFAINETKLILHKLILKYNIRTKSGKVESKMIVGPNALPSRSALVFENRK